MDYAVVMAGGSGKRLWPLSRKNRPKQILKLLDGQTLLKKCFERLCPIFGPERILITTNAAYIGIVRENLPDLPVENIIAEPCVRDTAGAIGLAACVLAKRDADATMAIVTADQLIDQEDEFQKSMKDAISFVNSRPQSLVTFGITPNRPSSQYGYIKCVDPQKLPCCESEIYKVEAFKEKPDDDTAKRYLDEGNYFWNSGMFVWKAETILSNLKKYLPEVVEPLKNIQEQWDTPGQKGALYEWFVRLPKISIDFAVMENAEDVYAIKMDCKWLDLGAFTALAEFIKSDGNENIIVAGQSQLLDCKDSIFVTEDNDHLIAAIGLENIVVAHTPDATLICTKDDTERLKELLEIIRQNTGERFL